MEPDCLPLHMFHLLGKKDFVPILEEFYFSRFTGFNALTRQLGITPHQLSIRLKELESISLIQKVADTYVLTPKGKDLGELVQRIKGFHARYQDGLESCEGKACSTCVHFVESRRE